MATAPLPPWLGDAAVAVDNAPDLTCQRIAPLRTIENSVNALLLEFGRLKLTFQELSSASLARMESILQVDEEQRRQEHYVRESTASLLGRDPAATSKVAQKDLNIQGFCSIQELHILMSDERRYSHSETLTRAADLAERVIKSEHLEAEFWGWLDIDNTTGSPSSSCPETIALRTFERAQSQSKYIDGMDSLWQKVTEANHLNDTLLDDLESAKLEVDKELRYFDRYLDMMRKNSEFIPFEDIRDQIDILHEASRCQSRLESTHRSVLRGALSLLEPHLPHGVQAVHFATARQRRKQQSSAGIGGFEGESEPPR